MHAADKAGTLALEGFPSAWVLSRSCLSQPLAHHLASFLLVLPISTPPITFPPHSPPHFSAAPSSFQDLACHMPATALMLYFPEVQRLPTGRAIPFYDFF